MSVEGVVINVGFPASGDSKDFTFLRVEFHLPLVLSLNEFVEVILTGMYHIQGTKLVSVKNQPYLAIIELDEKLDGSNPYWQHLQKSQPTTSLSLIDET